MQSYSKEKYGITFWEIKNKGFWIDLFTKKKYLEKKSEVFNNKKSFYNLTLISTRWIFNLTLQRWHRHQFNVDCVDNEELLNGRFVINFFNVDHPWWIKVIKQFLMKLNSLSPNTFLFSFFLLQKFVIPLSDEWLLFIKTEKKFFIE